MLMSEWPVNCRLRYQGPKAQPVLDFAFVLEQRPKEGMRFIPSGETGEIQGEDYRFGQRHRASLRQKSFFYVSHSPSRIFMTWFQNLRFFWKSLASFPAEIICAMPQTYLYMFICP
jgi:hypothetical protein